VTADPRDARDPRVAVVVCTRDRVDHLRSSLAALATVLRPEDDRVVVDSASRDADGIAAVAAEAGFRVVRCERPGLARARNAGIAGTDAPVVAFTDDDCRAAPGWTERLAAAFRTDDAVGFVTGAVAADRETKLPLAVGSGGAARRFGRTDDPLKCGHGANIAFRRAALEAVGGFDEALGAGTPLRAAEDSDMFWRLLAAGWAGVHDPEAIVTHVQWRTTGEALRISWGYGIGAGAMVVKGIRSGRRDGWRLLGRLLWTAGVRQSWRDLRAGYQTGAVSAVARMAGVVDGAARGAVHRLADDRFA
jgi:GT2 family glycosyltransferase